MHIFNSKKVAIVGKKTRKKSIIFYTRTILLSVIYSADKQTVVIINSKCFEIQDQTLRY